jgi:2-keto-4-pentenoate hydratase
MINETILTAANRLKDAASSQITCSPIRELIGEEDIALAYQIQKTNIEHLKAAGASVLGYKIGLTSTAVQKQLGVDQPDFGVLLDTMEIHQQVFPFSALMQPKAEAEIAFILKEDLTSETLGLNELIDAIDYAVASIEIVGSRIENWNIRITDTIADNASASHFVLGKKQVPLKDIDLVNCSMSLTKNGRLASEGTGAACMDNPLNAALWLAKTMIGNKNPLKKGAVLLTGALGPMVPIGKGDTITASITGFDTITLNFD